MDEQENITEQELSPKKKRRWPYVLLTILVLLLGSTAFLLGTDSGRSLVVSALVSIFYDDINVVEQGDDMNEQNVGQEQQAQQNVSNEQNPNPEIPDTTPTPVETQPDEDDFNATLVEEGDFTVVPEMKIREEDYVYNVLLIGVEQLPVNGGRGRSDTMMIASINIKDKSIKLTSLLRDMWVEIPGYEDNRINAAYAYGGTALLVETVEHNFKIKINSYVQVGFDGFEQLIDTLGGVEVTLSGAEATYLNTTNYISDKAQRNVIVGKQTLTGNQALGYCRIRHEATPNGLKNDYGRTYRQRLVLTQLFNKYIHSSLKDLVKILTDCLNMVTTDMTQRDMSVWLSNVVNNKIFTLETFQVPVQKYFQDSVVSTGAKVLTLDFEGNIEQLHEFIFATE